MIKRCPTCKQLIEREPDFQALWDKHIGYCETCQKSEGNWMKMCRMGEVFYTALERRPGTVDGVGTAKGPE